MIKRHFHVKGAVKHFHTNRKTYTAAASGIFTAFIVLGSVFFITRGTAPSTSELAYIEKSIKASGSVIPASGESYPAPDTYPPADSYPSYPPPDTYPPADSYPSYFSYETYETYETYPTYPVPTGTLVADPTSCTIATGASTCNSTLTWTTTNPIGTSQVIGDGGGPYSTAANNYNQSLPVAYGGKTFRLYNGGYELANDSVSATCATGGWDSVSGTCTNPNPGTPAVIGQYGYDPVTGEYSGGSAGRIDFTCNNSNRYRIMRDGIEIVPLTAHAGPTFTISITPTVSGNYAIWCSYGSYENPVSGNTYYWSSPPGPIVSLDTSPRTISKDQKVTISWNVKFPANSCTFTAKVVCTNEVCSASQTAYQTTLNTLLNPATEKTDTDDPSTSRFLWRAIGRIAPQFLTNPPADYRALGKKTVKVSHTTDFTLDCTAAGGSRETRRVRVTTSNEQ